MDYQGLLIFAPVLLFSVIAHEYAHGYAALRQGDDTALLLGRLSWNPVKHIDPFMTIILPIALWLLPGGLVLAGAKPVPVDPRKYRDYVRGDIIVSLAGIATNLVIAFGCVLAYLLLGSLGRAVPAVETFAGVLQVMMRLGLLLNLVLVLFNLLPIPPLDGSHVIKHLLPPGLALRYQQLARYGIIVLVVVMYAVPGVISTVMSPAYRTYGWTVARLSGSTLPSVARWTSR